MNIRCLLTALHASEKLFNLLKFLSGISGKSTWQIVQKFSAHSVMEEYVQTDEMVTTKGYTSCVSPKLTTMNVSGLTKKHSITDLGWDVPSFHPRDEKPWANPETRGVI